MALEKVTHRWQLNQLNIDNNKFHAIFSVETLQRIACFIYAWWAMSARHKCSISSKACVLIDVYWNYMQKTNILKYWLTWSQISLKKSSLGNNSFIAFITPFFYYYLHPFYPSKQFSGPVSQLRLSVHHY